MANGVRVEWRPVALMMALQVLMSNSFETPTATTNPISA